MLERKDFIINKEDRILLFLNLFGNHQDILKSELQKRAESANLPYIGASFNHLLDDCLALKLISNGGKYNLTDLGKRLINNKDNRDIWKAAYLQVPSYKLFYENYPNSKDFGLFNRFCYSNYGVPSNELRKLFGMGLRRFFEGFYQMKLPSRIKKPIKRKLRRKILKVIEPSNKNQQQIDIIDNSTQFIKNSNLKEVLLGLGLKIDDIIIMINSLPQDKKDILIRELLK